MTDIEKKYFKLLAIIVLLIALAVSLSHAWYCTFRELDNFDYRLKEQELKIHALKEQLEFFERMYIEIALIDSAQLADIIYATISTPQMEKTPLLEDSADIKSGAPESGE